MSPSYFWGNTTGPGNLFTQIVCSTSGQFVFATEGSNLYISTNFGRSWSAPKPANTLATGLAPSSIGSVACDGTGLNIFVTVNDNGGSQWPLLFSNNAGATFSSVSGFLNTSSSWGSIACDPTGQYICATDNTSKKVLYSKTGPTGSWLQSAAFTNTFSTQLVVSAESTGNVYVYLVDSVGNFAISSDSGATWAPPSNIPSWPGLNFIACNGSGSTVYVASNTSSGSGNVWKSVDYGNSWTNLAASPVTNGAHISCDYTGNSVLLSDFTAGSPNIGYTYFSNDGGATWAWQTTVPTAGSSNDIVLLSSDASHFFSVVLGTALFVYPPPITCFKEGSKILCLVDSQEKYIPVENIRRGTLVKTALNGYKMVDMIGYQVVQQPNSKQRIKEQLYVCSNKNYPEVFEDLVLTGCHCILVDNFSSEEERAATIEVNGKIFITGNKYRLPACTDKRTDVYPVEGDHTVYHFALENDDMRMNYGVYANGLLVETSSKRHLQDWKNMTML